MTTLDDIDPGALQSFIARRKDAQNLGLGMLGGLLGAALGAGLWAAITAVTSYQIGFMAIGVGFLTGFGVRVLGKGIDPIFGYVGAVFSLAGCVVGNLLTVMFILSSHEHIPFGLIASKMTPALAWTMLSADFNIIDVVFYGLALYTGYRYSFHRITQSELESLRRSGAEA